MNPSLPFWGGPSGVRSRGFAAGDPVYSYGNSSLRAGVEEFGPKAGTIVEDHPSGWSHTVYTATPGIPGDSGSGFVDAAVARSARSPPLRSRPCRAPTGSAT